MATLCYFVLQTLPSNTLSRVSVSVTSYVSLTHLTTDPHFSLDL